MSVTVQVTIVIPIGNVSGASFVTLSTPQLSETTGVPKLNSNEQLITSGGHETIGASLSTTVTVIEQVELLPQASVAVQITVVVPTG